MTSPTHSAVASAFQKASWRGEEDIVYSVAQNQSAKYALGGYSVPGAILCWEYTGLKKIPALMEFTF